MTTCNIYFNLSQLTARKCRKAFITKLYHRNNRSVYTPAIKKQIYKKVVHNARSRKALACTTTSKLKIFFNLENWQNNNYQTIFKRKKSSNEFNRQIVSRLTRLFVNVTVKNGEEDSCSNPIETKLKGRTSNLYLTKNNKSILKCTDRNSNVLIKRKVSYGKYYKICRKNVNDKCSSSCELNPIISNYKLCKSKISLSKRCKPKPKKGSLWKLWFPSFFAEKEKSCSNSANLIRPICNCEYPPRKPTSLEILKNSICKKIRSIKGDLCTRTSRYNVTECEAPEKVIQDIPCLKIVPLKTQCKELNQVQCCNTEFEYQFASCMYPPKNEYLIENPCKKSSCDFFLDDFETRYQENVCKKPKEKSCSDRKELTQKKVCKLICAPKEQACTSQLTICPPNRPTCKPKTTCSPKPCPTPQTCLPNPCTSKSQPCLPRSCSCITIELPCSRNTCKKQEDSDKELLSCKNLNAEKNKSKFCQFNRCLEKLEKMETSKCLEQMKSLCDSDLRKETKKKRSTDCTKPTEKCPKEIIRYKDEFKKCDTKCKDYFNPNKIWKVSDSPHQQIKCESKPKCKKVTKNVCIKPKKECDLQSSMKVECCQPAPKKCDNRENLLLTCKNLRAMLGFGNVKRCNSRMQTICNIRPKTCGDEQLEPYKFNKDMNDINSSYADKYCMVKDSDLLSCKNIVRSKRRSVSNENTCGFHKMKNCHQNRVQTKKCSSPCLSNKRAFDKRDYTTSFIPSDDLNFTAMENINTDNKLKEELTKLETLSLELSKSMECLNNAVINNTNLDNGASYRLPLNQLEREIGILLKENSDPFDTISDQFGLFSDYKPRNVAVTDVKLEPVGSGPDPDHVVMKIFVKIPIDELSLKKKFELF